MKGSWHQKTSIDELETEHVMDGEHCISCRLRRLAWDVAGHEIEIEISDHDLAALIEVEYLLLPTQMPYRARVWGRLKAWLESREEGTPQSSLSREQLEWLVGVSAHG